MATVVTTRVKREIVKSPNLKENVITVFQELDKLVDYYQAEIKQAKLEYDRYKEPETQQMSLGRIQAYGDHIAEISYIRDILRDLDKDMEA